MKATVDPDLCIGCGKCEEICPEVFELDDELAVVKADPVPDEVADACQEAADECPVEAISVEP